MLNCLSQLDGSNIIATDGAIGRVKEAYFDDDRWAIRYLVIGTGDWLAGRDVLISPYAVRQPVGSLKNIDVLLTQQQVRDSPVTDTHQPVSRRHEREYLSYYAYPEYWGGGDLWAMSALPLLPPPVPTALESPAERARREQDVPAEDVHLRSSAEVRSYDIQATDASIGHVHDFVFDDESWAVRYLVVDTRNWWPGGKKVLLATHWIDRIDWPEKTVYTKLTREQVKNSPAYDEGAPIAREYERQLHDAYGRKAYWD